LFPGNEARAQAAGMAFERSYQAAVNRHGLTTLPGANETMDKLTGAQIVAGVLTGPHTVARLRRAGATHLIKGIAELPDLVA
jgi:phosphoglycolate phosphatase-like HAD superfamily hydrolase